MSHLPHARSLTSSQRPSPSSPFVASMSPLPSRSSPTAASGTDVLSVLNQNTIPHTHSTVKSNSAAKASPIYSGPPTISTTPQAPSDTATHFPSAEHLRQRKVAEARSLVTPTPTTSSGKDTPESDFLGYDDLKILRTRSTEPSDYISSSQRQVPKPDSPTLHLDNNPLRVIMPRTSSIDSAISNVSTASPQRTAGDMHEYSPTSVRSLIATAGGTENLIAHLLKDKNNLAAQNAQLWKLVEKQRMLLLGLNKDLERATKERDRYKKKAKELQQTVQAVTKPGKSPDLTENPAPDVMEKGHRGPLETTNGIQPRAVIPDTMRSPMDPAMMPRPLHSRDNSRSLASSFNEFSKTAGASAAAETAPDVSSVELEPAKPYHAGTDFNDHSQQSFVIAEPSPISDKTPKSPQSSRKAPPKPLNLARPKDELGLPHQDSATSEVTSFEDEPDRGRRKTREEDDRERERSALQEEQARSKSKKDSKSASKSASKAPQEPSVEPRSQPAAAIPHAGLPLSPRPQHAQGLLSPVLSPSAILGERTLTSALKSPGLPVSPRPMHNPANFTQQLPLSPRANLGSFPLSPRAPKQPLPVPTDPAAPVDATLLQTNHHKTSQPLQMPKLQTGVDRLNVHEPTTAEPPSVYRGLVDANYPNLLLPPNALPSIYVKVVSSRQKSTRNSVLGVRSQEDTTIFSLAISSRSSNSELWRVEKVPSTLPQLEQQLKLRCPELPKMPERKLFVGHSPALLDARRNAIDNYFEQLLDTHVDDQAGVTICNYLSSDVIDPDSQDQRSRAVKGDSPINHIAKAIKTGYLTKKGKNFGGWKSRFFVLEGYELRYFESASGSHLGTIRLQNAQIGKPKPDEAYGDDGDGQFRHALLIQEPKRKDSTNYVRHVLCAESDEERDEWISLLMKCADGVFNEPQVVPNKRSTSLVRDNYPSKDTLDSSPTPTSGSSDPASPVQEHYQREGRSPLAAISGPLNGSVIKDTSAWAHKAPAFQQPPVKDVRDKGYKMSNIFGFKKAEPVPSTVPEQKPKPRILRHNGYIRPVFGLPLAEAVEFCSPFHIDTELPAVVYRSIEYLRFRDAASEEGLFRLSGSNSTVRALRERFNTEGDVDLVASEEYHDIHAVTSLFKSYLRELPSSILTRELHVDFMKVLELRDTSEKVAAFNGLVHRLPRINFVLLKELSHFLLEVTQSADKNKMSVRNMGIVFSPTLNIPPPVFHLFLTEFQAIFETEGTDLPKTQTVEVRVQDLNPTDIRSPRHQMFSDLPTPAPHQTSFPGLPTNPHDKGHLPHPGDFGLVPVAASYESGGYVSNLQDNHRPVVHMQGQATQDGAFSSIGGMLAPRGPAASHTERRHSAFNASPHR